jgi:hypothetical protein
MITSLDFVIVMAGLYLIECVRRVGPGELTLDRSTRSGFRLKFPVPYPNSTRWGWVMLNPLRPDGPTFSLMLAPSLIAEPEDISTDAAFSRSLDATRFDLDGIREGWATLGDETCGARTIALALFAVCFGLFPGCILLLGLKAALPPTAAVVLVSSIYIAALYRRSAGPIAPGATALDLYGNLVKLVLYPIAAIRCMDLLSRDSLAAFDPIAVTALLCDREQAAHLAARELVILRFSLPPQEVNTDSKLAIAEYRAARLQLLESFVAQQGLPVQAFIDPPAQTDETCKTYCPVCGAQFKRATGVCSDCPSILLQPLRTVKRLRGVGSEDEEHA